MALFGLIGNDRKMAATTYAGRESANDRNARLRRESYHNGGATKAARKGQAWLRKQR